jgi:transcriptional regulator
MHPASVFHRQDRPWLCAHLREFPFCQITTVSTGGQLVCTHAPVLLDEVRGVARFHLSARSPVALALEAGQSALIVSLGHNAYINPDWYGPPPDGKHTQVPTWNYQSVELEGPACALAPDDTAAQVNDLSALFEARLLPKTPWTSEKMADSSFEKLISGIRGFEVTPQRFEGMSKMSQNKGAAVRNQVIAALLGLDDTASHGVANAMAELNPTLP